MGLNKDRKVIAVRCISVNLRNTKDLTLGKTYTVKEIEFSIYSREDTYRFNDDAGSYRNLPRIGVKAEFELIYEDVITSNNTTSDKEGLYSIQDIENVLGKFDFDTKDLEEVIKEFRKLTLKTEEKKDEEVASNKEERDDGLPF